MSELLWILLFGLIMSLVALEGAFLPERVWNRCLLWFIAFAAGSLVGGAVLHMIPAAIDAMGNQTSVYCWLLGGFMLFYALEEFLNWHHSHTHSHGSGVGSSPSKRPGQQLQHPSHPTKRSDNNQTTKNNDRPEDVKSNRVENDGGGDETSDIELGSSRNASNSNTSDRQQQPITTTNDTQQQPISTIRRSPMTYLILIADAVHNLVGGMSVGASFVDSFHLGLSAWFAAVSHEIPQELGDFAILVHGGWSKRNALLFNFLSALTFPLGGVIAYTASKSFDVAFLIPFARFLRVNHW
eukprot:CAMPEP_0178733074 /NCGR_PEP_ID=MMETSP0744-20121128/601_1 /TAXON_ID=913974 /ORGANISM="Nitzschia punctata, Strain CCMP561" /LENGTH=296 /DNA_ID=CAMNT_0020385233 /DNA_START=283 /DNA_END=1171 /DNA_ORIENTATION=+